MGFGAILAFTWKSNAFLSFPESPVSSTPQNWLLSIYGGKFFDNLEKHNERTGAVGVAIVLIHFSHFFFAGFFLFGGYLCRHDKREHLSE